MDEIKTVFNILTIKTKKKSKVKKNVSRFLIEKDDIKILAQGVKFINPTEFKFTDVEIVVTGDKTEWDRQTILKEASNSLIDSFIISR